LDADHRILAAIGARAAIDRTTVLRGATESLGYSQKLDELQERGFISEQDKEILLILTDAGSASVHRAGGLHLKC
jgi:hypothetical protein